MQKIKKIPRIDYAEVLYNQAKILKPNLYKKMGREHTFARGRKFRFDIVILEHNLAIEIDGVAVNRQGKLVRGGGRHSASNDNDYIKNNLAVKNNFRLLKYTSKMVKEDSLFVLEDIEKTIQILTLLK